MTSTFGVIILSLCLVILCDVGLALHFRRLHPVRARRSWLRDLPSVPFTVGAVTMRVSWTQPITDEVVGTIVIMLTGMVMVMWEIVDGAPVHPLVAALMGVFVGALFWI